MEVNYREFLDLKASQLILLHAIIEEAASPQEIVDYFAINFPEFYSKEAEEDSKGKPLNKRQIFAMLRYLGTKEFIMRDRSQRWMITPKGRGALIQNAFLTFRNVMQTITNSYLTGFLPPTTQIGGDLQTCLSIEPLNFPAFPSPVTKSRISQLKRGELYLVDIGSKGFSDSQEKIENLIHMQNHLDSLSAEVKVRVGDYQGKFRFFQETQASTNTQELTANLELIEELASETIDSCLVQFLFALADNPKGILQEIYRVLKLGQFVILVDYTTDKSLFQIYQRTLFQNLEEVDLPPTYQQILKPQKERTKEIILSIIKQTSFKVVEVVDIPNLPRFVLRKTQNN